MRPMRITIRFFTAFLTAILFVMPTWVQARQISLGSLQTEKVDLETFEIEKGDNTIEILFPEYSPDHE